MVVSLLRKHQFFYMKGKSNFELLSHHGIGDIYYDHASQQRSFVATRDIKAGEVVYLSVSYTHLDVYKRQG